MWGSNEVKWGSCMGVLGWCRPCRAEWGVFWVNTPFFDGSTYFTLELTHSFTYYVDIELFYIFNKEIFHPSSLISSFLSSTSFLNCNMFAYRFSPSSWSFLSSWVWTSWIIGRFSWFLIWLISLYFSFKIFVGWEPSLA